MLHKNLKGEEMSPQKRQNILEGFQFLLLAVFGFIFILRGLGVIAVVPRFSMSVELVRIACGIGGLTTLIVVAWGLPHLVIKSP